MFVSGCIWDADETFTTEDQGKKGFESLQKVNSPEERKKREEREKARVKEEQKVALYEAGPPQNVQSKGEGMAWVFAATKKEN